MILDIRGLTLGFASEGQTSFALTDVSLTISSGEIVGLVGESGSGKSVTALSILGLLPQARVRPGEAGEVVVLGRDVLALGEPQLREMRGRDVSMVFQEPLSALNPVLRIGSQMVEVLRRHRSETRNSAARRALELLRDVQIADPERVFGAFPHELSGGMRQRVLIAMAFSCHPKLIIADEATTALDVTVQARILQLLRERAAATGTAILLISHDLAVVSELCHRTYVMFKGRIVESGATADVIQRPRAPYTRALLNALPNGKAPRARLETAAAAMAEPAAMPSVRSSTPARVVPASPSSPLLEAHDIVVRYPRDYDVFGRPKSFQAAVDGVSVSVFPGETLSIVGESGSGKTSLAQALVGLTPIDHGVVKYRGAELACATPAQRREIQMVFQDPMSSLDPRWPIWRTLTEPPSVARLSRRARRAVARDLCAMVGLDPAAIDRRPHEFSGGQRQRIAIGRALSVEPRLLVLDEPTSALDVSVQAQILNLLLDLQDRSGLTYVFISHNMAVVRHVSDRVAVMVGGRIVEQGPADRIIAAPDHAYTRALLAAVPRFGLAPSQ